MFDIISVGDATIDSFFKIHDATVKCELNNINCQICLNYADKIPVDELTHTVAGNAANNAVGSSRLGLKTAIYVNVGTDDSGFRIKKALASEKVFTDYIITREGMESNYSAVISFMGERTILVYHQPWKYELPKLDKSSWVYLTSVSASYAQSNLYNDLVDYLKTNQVKLAYNPGTYQLGNDVKKDAALLSLCEVFIVNREEAEKILELAPEADTQIKDLLKGLKNLGPKYVVITDGREGSYATDGTKDYKIAEWPMERVEATGAGDSYATAVVAALFHEQPLNEAMVWGAINGASVAHEVGPQKGLQTLAEIQSKRKEKPDFKAEII